MMLRPPEEDPSPDASRRLITLLRVKRHEVPPPGFHRDFAPGVIRRIESEARARARTPWWLPGAWLPRLAGANGVLALGVVLLGFSAARFALKEKPSGTPETATAALVPGTEMQLAGPGSPVTAGAGLHGPSLLQLDPAVLRPVQFPAASNEWPHRAFPNGPLSLPPGIYRVQFAVP